MKGFLVLLLALASALSAKAEFFYSINNGSVTITAYIGSDSTLVIPDTLDGFPVVAIGFGAFEGCVATNVLISSNVVSIGSQAFQESYNLTTIDIPDSVTNIGDYAFDYCPSLTDIAIGSNVVSIGEAAFDECFNLTTVYIPGNVAVIGTYAFDFCRSLTNVVISNGLGSIADDAFESCGKLNSILIPNSVTNIGSWAFAFCSSLSNVVVPDNVLNIGEGAFAGSGLTSIGISENVASIGNSAFASCLNLTNISVSPDNLSYGCSDGILFDKSFGSLLTYPAGLKGNYTVPNTVTNISGVAFLGCVGLTNVTIPESVVQIGTSAFIASTNLNNIFVSRSNEQYSSVGGVLFNKDRTTLLAYPQGKTGGYAIPHTVTDIGSDAFVGCRKLRRITIPKGVLSIEDNAFFGCSSLVKVSIPASVTNYGYNAFRGCAGLKSITLPNSITEISDSMFDDCSSLTNITIPNGVGSIDGFAFAACGSLRSVVFPNSLTNIGNDAFGGCWSLTNIIFPASVVSIGDDAFENGSLMNAFFLGNPPAAGDAVFGYNPGIVYYLPSSTGWSNSYGGWPTVPATSGTVTVSASPSSGGRVSGDAGTFPPGSSVTVSAAARKGFAFANWTQDGNVVSSAADYTFMMFGDTDLQANFVDIVPPRLVVLYPRVKQRLSADTISGTGRASDNVDVAAVYYQLNQGNWSLASGTTNWVAANLQLNSGSNTLSVYAVDDGGNCSKTNKLVFFDGM